MPRLSFPGACARFSDKGASLCLLHWQAGSSLQSRQEGQLFPLLI